MALVQTDLRRRILLAFVGRGLLESCDAKEMLAYQHSGFSVDAGVRIEPRDRAALERLLRDGLNNHPPNEVAVGQFSNSEISRVIFRNRVVFYAQMSRLRAL